MKWTLQDIIDLLNGPDCPEIIPVFADENNVGDLIQRLFDSWHELNDLVEDIHQRTDR